MEAKTLRKNDDFLQGDFLDTLSQIGKQKALHLLDQMLLVRNFEVRAEAAYLQGKVGGFFHSYTGQEAIQVAAVGVFGADKNWYITSYRCHALALLLGVTPDEAMKELFGRVDGNAKGRGGSMHLYADRLLGGEGIVGGQIPLATGAAFSLKYQGLKDEVAVCFLGDGAVAQGAFHEALNIASLWNLPCIYVIENNHWGMGTSVDRAIANKRIAEEKASGYNMEGYTVDGMDLLRCHATFAHFQRKVLETGRPVLVEFITERFTGHSISDPGLYRSKGELAECKKKDPITLFKNRLIDAKYLTEEDFKARDKKFREQMIALLKSADDSPWPDPILLEEEVFST